MTEPPSDPPSVSLSELLNAVLFASTADEFGGGAYVCRSTGKTYFVSDAIDPKEFPPDLEESDDYIAVPTSRDLNLGTRLVFAFVDDEMPEHRHEVSDIFRRKGAFGRFRGFLDHHNMLDRWYAHEAAATERAVRDWCEEEELPLSDAPS